MMPNFINMYFGLCLVVWAIDVIAVIVLLIVKPLRKWCWKKYLEFSREFIKLYMSVFDN